MSSVRCVCSPQSPPPPAEDTSTTTCAAAVSTSHQNAAAATSQLALMMSAAPLPPQRFWSQPDESWTTAADGTTTLCVRTSGGDDDELNLPRSVINKLIKESAGRIRVSAEARDVLVACCHEFVRVLSARANLNCERHKKKLIGPDHILSALTEMGLQSYQTGCIEVMSVAQEEAAQKRKRMSLRYDCDGVTEDELRREQQELFAKARQEHCELFTAEDLADAQQAAKFLINSSSMPCSADDDYDQAD